MSDIKINLDEIDFHFIGAEVLDQCPHDKGPHFTDGFLFYTQEFFDTLNTLVPFFQFGDGYSELPLDFFIQGPLDYLDRETRDLNNIQKNDFLKGFNLGMEESCKAIQLALSPAIDKLVA